MKTVEQSFRKVAVHEVEYSNSYIELILLNSIQGGPIKNVPGSKKEIALVNLVPRDFFWREKICIVQC
jgi:hypothetical protein